MDRKSGCRIELVYNERGVYRGQFQLQGFTSAEGSGFDVRDTIGESGCGASTKEGKCWLTTSGTALDTSLLWNTTVMSKGIGSRISQRDVSTSQATRRQSSSWFVLSGWRIALRSSPPWSCPWRVGEAD